MGVSDLCAVCVCFTITRLWQWSKHLSCLWSLHFHPTSAAAPLLKRFIFIKTLTNKKGVLLFNLLKVAFEETKSVLVIYKDNWHLSCPQWPPKQIEFFCVLNLKIVLLLRSEHFTKIVNINTSVKCMSIRKLC